MLPGIGTVVNVVTVLVGTVLGVLVGHRLPQRTRDVVTDGLGLVTLLIAGTAAAAVTDDALTDAVGPAAPMLIVLGSVLIGGIVGSLLRIEDRLEGFGGLLQRAAVRRFGAGGGSEAATFIQGFVAASLVFCVGPLTVLGSINDGLGNGADQLSQVRPRRVRRDRVRRVVRLGRGRQRGRPGRRAGPPHRARRRARAASSPTPTSRPDRHRRPDALGVALRLLHLKQLTVGDLLPACWSRRCWSQVVASA